MLQSYEGQVRNVGTMAHELGHAVHSLLASAHGVLTHHPALPLAETASTFGEMLLVDRLLDGERDPEVRRDLLMGRMDDSYATIQRQAYFALFEREAHAERVAGATVDDLSESIGRTCRSSLATSLDLSDEFRFEWVSIPAHLPYPLLRLCLRLRPTSGAGPLPSIPAGRRCFQAALSPNPGGRRRRFAGGILASAGMDIRDPGFWQGGFDVLKADLKELELLAAEGYRGATPGEPGRLVVLVDRERAIAQIRHYGFLASPGEPRPSSPPTSSTKCAARED